MDVKEEIKAFQLKHKLTPDGLIGPQTWEVIKKEMEA
jgi:peptidoglycan hydrolase-like protein with peptidoglycan-binding domain